jgi:hypothetical protein
MWSATSVHVKSGEYSFFFENSGATSNSRRQKGTMKQDPYWGCADVRGHRIKCSGHGDLAPRICARLSKTHWCYHVRQEVWKLFATDYCQWASCLLFTGRSTAMPELAQVPVGPPLPHRLWGRCRAERVPCTGPPRWGVGSGTDILNRKK